MQRHFAGAWGVLLLALTLGCGDSATGPGPDGYTEAELTYFAEIAFGAEFAGSANPLLHRWEAGPSIRVHGTPTAADEAILTRAIEEINALIRGVRLERTDGAGDIDLYFVPQADFPLYEPNAVPGATGFVWVWWDRTQRIVRARVMVASDISQEGRSHVIREELTQALGLLRDSPRYPESIFYAASALTQSYAPVDRAVIEMLYRPELAPGMTRERALLVLTRLRRRGTPAVLSGGRLTPSKPSRAVHRATPVLGRGSAGAASRSR